MRSLLNFLFRFKTLILFLVLEGVALVLISTSHNYHQTAFYRLSRNITGFVARQAEGATSYLSLRQVNKELAEENAWLRNRLERSLAAQTDGQLPVTDSVKGVHFTYLNARVISNSVNKQKNFILIDRGARDGVTTGMGVASPAGVAGIVVGVSRNYSVVMSLLNTDFRLSASLAHNDYFGSLAWDGLNYRYATLTEIPHHVTVHEGDTIVTSGFSAIFPPGLVAGTLTGEQKRGGDFISMKVELSVDFKKLTSVYIISNLTREEREELERGVE